MNEANYSTFRLFEKNVSQLKSFRPDLYVVPNEKAYSILGSETKRADFPQNFESILSKVWALNTSIILNTTGYFEGLLESLLLRKVSTIKVLPEPINSIIDDYKIEIVKISSLGAFNSHFKKIYGCSLSELSSNKNDYKFIDDFYLIRHLLSHGSMIKTEYVKLDVGSTLVHIDNNYQKLLETIKIRNSYSFDLNIELYWLILCSEIVDDFSQSVFSVSKEIIANLIATDKLDAEEGWSNFKSWGEWGKL